MIGSDERSETRDATGVRHPLRLNGRRSRLAPRDLTNEVSVKPTERAIRAVKTRPAAIRHESSHSVRQVM